MLNDTYDRHIGEVLDAKTPFDGNRPSDRAIITNAAIAFACKVLNEADPSRERRDAALYALDAVLDYRYRNAVGTLIEAEIRAGAARYIERKDGQSQASA
jgi:hypothetical protein